MTTKDRAKQNPGTVHLSLYTKPEIVYSRKSPSLRGHLLLFQMLFYQAFLNPKQNKMGSRYEYVGTQTQQILNNHINYKQEIQLQNGATWQPSPRE